MCAANQDGTTHRSPRRKGFRSTRYAIDHEERNPSISAAPMMVLVWYSMKSGPARPTVEALRPADCSRDLESGRESVATRCLPTAYARRRTRRRTQRAREASPLRRPRANQVIRASSDPGPATMVATELHRDRPPSRAGNGSQDPTRR